MQCDIALLQETAINNTNSTYESLRGILKCTWKHTHYKITSVPDEGGEKYLPGGTVSIINGPALTRIQEHGNDPYGRWTWHTLAGGNNDES